MDDALAALEGVGLGLVESLLQVLDMQLEGLAVLLGAERVLLLLSELLSQAGRVGGGLAHALLAELELAERLVQVDLHGGQVVLDLALLGSQVGTAAAHLADVVGGVVQVVLGRLARALRLLHAGAHLLDLAEEGGGAPLGIGDGFARLDELAALVLHRALQHRDLAGQAADLGGVLVGQAVRVVQRDLQLVDVQLELLLLSVGLGASLHLGVQTRLNTNKAR